MCDRNDQPFINWNSTTLLLSNIGVVFSRWLGNYHVLSMTFPDLWKWSTSIFDIMRGFWPRSRSLCLFTLWQIIRIVITEAFALFIRISAQPPTVSSLSSSNRMFVLLPAVSLLLPEWQTLRPVMDKHMKSEPSVIVRARSCIDGSEHECLHSIDTNPPARPSLDEIHEVYCVSAVTLQLCVLGNISSGGEAAPLCIPWIYSLSDFISQFFADVTVQEDTGSSARVTGVVASLFLLCHRHPHTLARWKRKWEAIGRIATLFNFVHTLGAEWTELNLLSKPASLWCFAVKTLRSLFSWFASSLFLSHKNPSRRGERLVSTFDHVSFFPSPCLPFPRQGHLSEGYGKLCSIYLKLLITKMEFHIKVSRPGL